MKNVSLVGISGMELRWIREQAGMPRSRLMELLRRRVYEGEDVAIGIDMNTIARYEKRSIVPVLHVQYYRRMIGEELFDELLVMARKAFAAGKLVGMIKWGRAWRNRKRPTQPKP